jgi:hypothetical protein
MKKAVSLGALALLTLVASNVPAFAQGSDFGFTDLNTGTTPLGGSPAGEASLGTAGSGVQGSALNNAATSDVTMTQGNQSSAFFVQPPNTTNSATTQQQSYQAITGGNPVGTGLLAPMSVLQVGNIRSFGGPFSLGFPSAVGPTLNTQSTGYNGGIPIVPLLLPTVGTPSTNLNVTTGGGY